MGEILSTIAWWLLVAVCTYLLLYWTLTTAAFGLVVLEWVKQKGREYAQDRMGYEIPKPTPDQS